MADPKSTFVLRECKRCRYASCICLVLTHAPQCPWRVALLDTSPKLCAPHEKVGCVDCNACNCGKPTMGRKAPVSA